MVKVLLDGHPDINSKEKVSRMLCVYVPQVMLVFLNDVLLLCLRAIY